MTKEDKLVLRIIMKMYSIESFLYTAVNHASRDKDQTKIKNLGPYAYILAKILQRLNPTINIGQNYIFQKRAPGFVTYRGTNLPREFVENY